MNNSKKKGFTIIELLAAIVIVGILASVAVLVINRYILQGHDTVDNQLEKQLVLSAKSYYSDNKKNFINVDDTGVVVWYTTLKANDYITNALEDSNGNSCSKSYVVVKDDKYTSCIICDNDGYNNTKNEVCTQSLANNISCEWRDNNGRVLTENDKTYLGIKKSNKATFKLYCKGRGITFNDPEGKVNKLYYPTKRMFTHVNGSIEVPNDQNNFNTSKNSKNEITSFTANVIYTAQKDGKASIKYKLGSSYVMGNNGVPVNNDDLVYSGIVIDGSGPSCKLSGPYKDNTLKTQVMTVKNGSTVYYGLSCEDKSGIGNVTTDMIKNGFESSKAVSNLVVSNLTKNNNQKSISATIGVTVTNPNINASKKVFDLSLVFKENIIKDNYDNGNSKATSQIDGKDTVLSIDDQGPTCAFNGPGSNAIFDIKKSRLDVTNDNKNEYVYYELRCTDENGINPSTFKFSDIKSTEFGRIEQSGDMLEIKNNENITIGYRYLIKAYEKNVSTLDKPIEAYLTYDEHNVVDNAGNTGSNSKKSLSVKMIDGKKVPTCKINISYSNGYAILTGTMNSQSGLKGYGWSTNSGELSSYTSASGTSKTVTSNAYSNDVYYLHMIDENDLVGYCKTDSYIYIPSPDTPYLNASDYISSGSWHNNNFNLVASGSGSGVTYHYGSSPYSMSPSNSYVSSETSGTTYYAKACWSNNSNICSSNAEYLAKLDKTPPICEYTTSKLNPVESYTPGYWTQRNVEIKFTRRYDSLSGIDDNKTYIEGYTQNWPNFYQTTVGNKSYRNHDVPVRCTDNAGNVTLKKVPVRIDTTPPKVSWSVSNGKTLYVGDTVTATCTDGESSISGIGGVYINGSDRTYGSAHLYDNYGKASVTFNSAGTKKLYITCSDTALNTTHDDYSFSNPQITVYVKEKTYTKTTSTMEYFWSSSSSGGGSCNSGVDCCSSSYNRTCDSSTHGRKYYTGCSSKRTCASYTTEYRYSASYECLKKSGKNKYFFSKNSSGSGSCGSYNCCRSFSCNASNHHNIKYVGCTSSRTCDYYETNYRYSSSYQCMRKSSPTVVTKKGQSSCSAGTETKSNGDNGTLIITTTCKLE